MGYGSVSTTIVTSQDDFVRFLKRIQVKLDVPLQLDVEKFVEGTMYHIDGESLLCSRSMIGFVANGKLRLCWPSKYLNMCLDYTHADFNASHSLQVSNPLV